MSKSEIYHALIIEDDHSNAFLIKTLLLASIQCGYTFLFKTEDTDNLKVALSRLEGNGIDIVFLDLNLRGQTIGFEGLDQLLAVSDVPIVIITGSVELGDAERAMARGAAAIWLKPIQLNAKDFIHMAWLAIHQQRRVRKQASVAMLPAPSGEIKKPSNITIAAIIGGATAILAGLVELLKAWKSK